MTYWYTDADLAGAGEFAEAEVWLAQGYTVAEAGGALFRWRRPIVAGNVTPFIRVFDAAGTLLSGFPQAFDTAIDGAWNAAGGGVRTQLGAGFYKVSVNCTRYPAVAGFFSGGPITRNGVTAASSYFGPPGAAPATPWPAAYFVDMDFEPGGQPVVTAAPAPMIRTAALPRTLQTAARQQILRTSTAGKVIS